MNLEFSEILYITLAALLALGFVFLSYFYKNKRKAGIFLPVLRFISVFILLLLLINPKIIRRETFVEKPNLVLVSDRSESIRNMKMTDSVLNFQKKIFQEKDLKDRFNITSYGFGNEIFPSENNDTLFNNRQSNQGNVLNELKKLKVSGNTAIIFISDGNQTFGPDYQYMNFPQNYSVYPVIVGDTTAGTDLSIENLNVNKYAFLKNKFPVEIIVNYQGETDQQTVLKINEGKATVFSQHLDFSSGHNSEVVKFELPANSLGSHLFSASLEPISSEKNILNNKQPFAVEVIEEKSSVLILSSFIHPDLGAIKKSVESNEQRTAGIKLIQDFDSSHLNDYSLIILYQPDTGFKKVFSALNSEKTNSFIITGTQTNWQFLNDVQNIYKREFSSQNQEIVPIYNPNYGEFQFEDIDFNSFPPLVQNFGPLTFNETSLKTLLYQKIEGVNTNIPLLATYTTDSQKNAVLFGENLWKWRSQSFQESGSFEKFDTFFGKLIQFLSAAKKRERLTYTLKPYFLEDENVRIEAQFFDKNYVFDPDGKVDLQIVKNDSLILETPMLVQDNHYIMQTKELSPGKYTFSLKEEKSGISKSGSFSVLKFNREQQYFSSNLPKMNALAANNKSRLFFLNDDKELIRQLLKDDSFKQIQKSHKKTLSLIDWKLLVLLLIVSLAVEWFLRKYNGLI